MLVSKIIAIRAKKGFAAFKKQALDPNASATIKRTVSVQ